MPSLPLDSEAPAGLQPADDDGADADGAADACRRELQALREEFERFTYGVSHDLRAPLRAIDNFSALLERRLGDDLDDTARDHLSRIRAASARMDGLMDALLRLSRVGRLELRMAPVDMSLLADWAAVELQDASPARPADIDVQGGLSALGDEALLRELMQLLLHNAWKFSGGCERVRIEVGGEREGDMLRLRVADRGSGFDMAHADKLFEPFQRLHGPAEGGGHGMGLAIARRIAERHGGAIRGEGVPGQGATFYVDLPAGPTSA
jgi:light-regulated signal transduction histidine kinase (bacteriophytochrome)